MTHDTNRATPPPTAVIVGAEPRVVVAIARSLHSHDVRCVVAVPPGLSLNVSSRAIAELVHLEGTTPEAASLLRLLVEAEHASWVVPTSDGALAVILAGYDELSRITAVGAPRPEIVEQVLDKSQTLAAARRCGVPVPDSVTITSSTEFESRSPELHFPLVAKPGDKSVKSVHNFKARKFASEEDLRLAFADDPEFGRGLIFQQYHPGQGVGIELLMHNGTAIARFQHRRLSEFPASGGVAVTAVSESLHPTLLDHAVRLLRELEWEGVAMVEFRHDPATDSATLMEVNGRFWGSIPLPIAAGMDFPWYAWQLAHALEPEIPVHYTEGMRVRWTAGALQRFASAFGTESNGRPGVLPAVRQLMSDFRPGTRSALWAWNDRTPAFQEATMVVKRWVKGGIKDVIRSLVPRPLLESVKRARNLQAGRRGHYLRRQSARSLRIAERQQLPENIQAVLFVCHGNIMRSAAAAQFLRDSVAANGECDIAVASAGTNTRVGRLADSRVKAVAQSFGTDLDTHRSQPLTEELVAAADVIFAMDDMNFVNIAATFPSSRGKLLLLGGIRSDGPYVGHEIVDPYLATEEDVRQTITRVRESVRILHQAMRRQRTASTSGR